MMEKGMTFTYQYDDGKPAVYVNIDKDSDIKDVKEAFQSFLLACGYHRLNISSILASEEEE